MNLDWVLIVIALLGLFGAQSYNKLCMPTISEKKIINRVTFFCVGVLSLSFITPHGQLYWLKLFTNM